MAAVMLCAWGAVGHGETLNTTKATRTAGMITVGYIQSPLYMQFENRRMVVELFIFWKLALQQKKSSDIFSFFSPPNVLFIAFIPQLQSWLL